MGHEGIKDHNFTLMNRMRELRNEVFLQSLDLNPESVLIMAR